MSFEQQEYDRQLTARVSALKELGLNIKEIESPEIFLLYTTMFTLFEKSTKTVETYNIWLGICPHLKEESEGHEDEAFVKFIRSAKKTLELNPIFPTADEILNSYSAK